jgi:hypothetical protein
VPFTSEEIGVVKFSIFGQRAFAAAVSSNSSMTAIVSSSISPADSWSTAPPR